MSDETPRTREFLAQRDLKIYQLRASGMAHTDIARQLDISTRAVTAAISRQTRKLNREASYAYPEVLRLELDRLDKLQASIWPLAHHRKQKLGDGTEITVEPDLKAVETLLKISQDRRKLLGLDAPQKIDVGGDIRHTLHGVDDKKGAIDYRSESKDLIELMMESRIIDEETGKAMLENLEEDTIDVEEIEEVSQLPADTDSTGLAGEGN